MARAGAALATVISRQKRRGAARQGGEHNTRDADGASHPVAEDKRVDLDRKRERPVCVEALEGDEEVLGGEGEHARMERLLLLIETLDKVPAELARQVDVYLVTLGEGTQQAALRLAEQLRDALPDLRLVVHCGGGSFKSQFKKADKSGALYALILGEAEAAAGQVGLKPLREDGEQLNLAWSEVPQHLANLL